MKFFVLSFLAFAHTSYASTKQLLLLEREKPFLRCEIYQGSVKISRKVQGYSFSHLVSYEMGDLAPLIDLAHEARDLSDLPNSEHSAFKNGTNQFKLDPQEPNALKLISIISTMCELRKM